MKNNLKISDFAIIKSGKRLPKGSFLTSEVTPHPYVRTRDIKNNQIEISNIQYLQPEIQKEINRYIVKTDDLIISIVGTVGSCALIPPELDNANLTENCAKIEVDEKEREKVFL